MNFVTERLKAHPAPHIYHCAPRTSRLPSSVRWADTIRHARNQRRHLLHAEPFVDVYPVVWQLVSALRASYFWPRAKSPLREGRLVGLVLLVRNSPYGQP